MKKWDKKYFRWGVTIFLVIAASILLYYLIGNIGLIFSVIGRLLDILSPLIMGLVLAFILNPIYKFLNRNIEKILEKKSKNKKRVQGFAKGFSIFLSVLFLLIVIVGLVWLVLPELINSIESIVSSIPSAIDSFEEWLDDVLKVNPEFEDAILSFIDTVSNSINSWMRNDLLPSMTNIASGVTNGLISVVGFIVDFFIGLVFAVYILISKKEFGAQAKKVSYCVFGSKISNKIIDVCKYISKLFNNVFAGKIFDSTLVGIICFLFMIITGMPYPVLIAVLIGVTDIIPFFGPFIGAIPAILLILVVSPIQALYFGIFILVLQQVEGNLLQPKVSGFATGISSFWALFAIIFFGDLFGLVGLIIGVPLFAVIYHYLKIVIDKRLKKNKMPVDTSAYYDIDYIDEENEKTDKKEN